MAKDQELSKEDLASLARLEDWWRKKPERAEPVSKIMRDKMASAEPPVPKEAIE